MFIWKNNKFHVTTAKLNPSKKLIAFLKKYNKNNTNHKVYISDILLEIQEEYSFVMTYKHTNKELSIKEVLCLLNKYFQKKYHKADYNPFVINFLEALAESIESISTEVTTKKVA